MKNLFITAAILMISVPAIARDSSHFVCSGFMTSQPGPDNYGISIQVDEYRAAYGDTRAELLSSVWAGNLYQGIRLNENNGIAFSGEIVMASKSNAKEVFYAGTYKLAQDTEGKYLLKLDGQLNLNPKDASLLKETVSTTLPCVNISN